MASRQVAQLRLVRIDKQDGQKTVYHHWTVKQVIERIAGAIGMSYRKALDRLQDGMVLETEFALYRFE